MTNVAGRNAYTMLYIITALAVGVWFSFYNNFFNWDIAAYMGVVLGYNGIPVAEAHQQAYSIIQHQFPPDAASALLHESAYREHCFADASFYAQQLSFYRVKPLFTGSAYLLYKCGLPLWTALRIPAAIGFAGLATVLLLWLNRMLKPGFSHLVAVLLLSGYATQLARLVTPDALSAFLVLLLFYLLMVMPQRKILAWSVLFLLALCRIDNLVLSLPLAYFQFTASGKQVSPKHLKEFALVSAVILLAATALPLFFGNRLSWFFEYSFTQSGMEYVKQLGRSVRQFSGTLFPILLPFVLVTLPIRNAMWARFLLMIAFAVIIRWLLFPAFQERFFVGYEMVIACYLLFCIGRAPFAGFAFLFTEAQRPDREE